MFNFLTTNLAESGPLTWDVAKQIIQTQSNLAMLAITVLVGLAVLLVAGSWIWNVSFSKRELKKAVESLKSEMFCESKKDFAHLKKEITDEASKMRQEIEKNILSQLTLLKAGTARIFAFINDENKWWAEAAAWWADAVVEYAECEEDRQLRTAVVALNRCLEKCEKQKMPLNKGRRKRIEECLSSIPKLLGKEKEEIEDKLKKLSG